MPEILECWKCGGELATRDTHPVKYYCAACDLELDERTARNPEHARAHHEEAEKGPEVKLLAEERLDEIVIAFETARVAAATAKKLFPQLFAAPGNAYGVPDPVAMGLMAGELLGHAIALTQALNTANGEARIWLMRVRDCPLAASGAEQACRMRDIAIEGLKAMGLDREPAAKA